METFAERTCAELRVLFEQLGRQDLPTLEPKMIQKVNLTIQ